MTMLQEKMILHFVGIDIIENKSQGNKSRVGYDEFFRHK